MQENNNTEFKREFVDEIKKTVIAFANTAGGKIYIGIDDDGRTVGVSDPDGVMLKCSNAIRDAIRPDVTMFVNYGVETRGHKHVVVVGVQRGTSVPYYLESKGIRPAGVYVRQGASSVPASETAILKMIKETDGDKYENLRSIQQELTFTAAEKEFDTDGVLFNEHTMRTLKLISEDGVYTNLGLLLSDQCPHTIKAAVFEGTNKCIFKDRAEFTGSLLEQINSVYEYVNRYNRTRSEFEGLHRIDIRDYPIEAIREALLNAVVHRDYAFSASILVSIFDDRIEIVSIGGLVRGITQDEIFMGLSVQRNESLANVFYRLSLIEAFGTGIPKIFRLYEDYNVKPTIETSENAFKITLPNTVSPREVKHEQKPDNSPDDSDILSPFRKKGEVTRSEIEKSANISQASASRIVRRLVAEGKLTKTGNGKNSLYIIN
ncbi:MAG: putative DNA binding domain-containing protein [Oscillospiraceae bacterium]|nr:putative DNA binding domain-containing protein [Oscillospiraceae bacterium]